MTQYEELLQVCEKVVKALRLAGMKEEHVEELRGRIIFLAGSYLPPVGAVLQLKLEPAKVNT